MPFRVKWLIDLFLGTFPNACQMVQAFVQTSLTLDSRIGRLDSAIDSFDISVNGEAFKEPFQKHIVLWVQVIS